MQGWAFARISLKLTDAEYLSYTTAEIEELTKAWESEREWEFALAMATSLNSKWSSKDNIIPFLPQEFLPKSPEEKAKMEAAQAKLQKAQQQFLAAGLQALAQSLPSTKNGETKNRTDSQS